MRVGRLRTSTRRGCRFRAASRRGPHPPAGTPDQVRGRLFSHRPVGEGAGGDRSRQISPPANTPSPPSPQRPPAPHGFPAGVLRSSSPPWRGRGAGRRNPYGGGGCTLRRRASCDARALRRPVCAVLPGSRCSPWRSCGPARFPRLSRRRRYSLATPLEGRGCLRPRGGPGRRSWWRRKALPTIPPRKEFARLLQPRVTAVHPAGTGTPPAAPLRADERSMDGDGVRVKVIIPITGQGMLLFGSRQWAVGSGVGFRRSAVGIGQSEVVSRLSGGGRARQGPVWFPLVVRAFLSWGHSRPCAGNLPVSAHTAPAAAPLAAASHGFPAQGRE